MANEDIQTEFREDLEEEIFNEIGKEVTLISKSADVYNERGERESSTQSSTTIVAVPYNIVNERQTHQSFGEFNEGDMDMVVKYNQTINIDDMVVIDGGTFKVKDIQKNYLPGNVATIVRLTKTEPLESDDV